MFRWDRKNAALIESERASPETRPSPGDAPGGAAGRQSVSRVPYPGWLGVVPFFLSAFFFLSALFAIFAPLPLLFMRYRSGRRIAWLAVVTNSAIVGFAAGPASLAVYGVFVVALAVSLPEFIERRRSLDGSAVLALVSMMLTAAAFLAGYAIFGHVNPFHELHQQIAILIEHVSQSASSGGLLTGTDAEEWKKSLITEFPSAVAVFGLVMVWTNLVVLLRANPANVRDRMGLDASFPRRWKAPEFLVWPTIASGFFLIFDAGRVSDVALNVFKVLMAIYAIQGLSILSFFFDLWNVRGIFRTLAFLAGIFLMMPLLLSLGFFDLWFDFRSKFRQS